MCVICLVRITQSHTLYLLEVVKPGNPIFCQCKAIMVMNMDEAVGSGASGQPLKPSCSKFSARDSTKIPLAPAQVWELLTWVGRAQERGDLGSSLGNGVRLGLWKAAPGDKRGPQDRPPLLLGCPGLPSPIQGSTAHPRLFLLIFPSLSLWCSSSSSVTDCLQGSPAPLTPPLTSFSPPWSPVPAQPHTTWALKVPLSPLDSVISAPHQLLPPTGLEKVTQDGVIPSSKDLQRKTLPSLSSCCPSPAQRVQPHKGSPPLPFPALCCRSRLCKFLQGDD